MSFNVEWNLASLTVLRSPWLNRAAAWTVGVPPLCIDDPSLSQLGATTSDTRRRHQDGQGEPSTAERARPGRFLTREIVILSPCPRGRILSRS